MTAHSASSQAARAFGRICSCLRAHARVCVCVCVRQIQTLPAYLFFICCFSFLPLAPDLKRIFVAVSSPCAGARSGNWSRVDSQSLQQYVQQMKGLLSPLSNSDHLTPAIDGGWGGGLRASWVWPGGAWSHRPQQGHCCTQDCAAFCT